ncbi:hypothetical protein QN277_019819 [Acacia crassicarpa]|uniref:TF-B3 domain-containing protein n=1 Tax=Acacia crassicarpa TaxID=499986 RepID=A0AAE1MNQ5_9FABA|nr:hypothetical protein QN277_019819 [Acacia crassicarpa]
MASNSQDPYSPIHFYRVISKTNLDVIMIPSKFTVRYGRCLSNPVCLKSPDGKEWKVYWEKRDNDFWFRKGWKEFTNFYSLDVGYLVLFKYEGTSQLGVHIIDKSALEIEYPFSMHASSQEDNLDNLNDDTVVILDKTSPSPEDKLDNLSDDIIEISDEMPQSPKASDNKPSSSSRPRKKMRSTTDKDVEMRSFNLQNMPGCMKAEDRQLQGTKLKTENTPFSSSRPLKKMRSTTDQDVETRSFNPQNVPVGMKTEDRQFQATKLQKSANADLKFSQQKSEGDTGKRIFEKSKYMNFENGMKKVLTAVKKDIALESASSLDTDKPHFTMVMQPSYVSPNPYLPIPKEFAKKNLGEDCEVVKLQALDGRIWHATYRSHKIGKGWKNFVNESGLKEGHVCAFEMIGPSLFKVHILRGAEKGNLKVNSVEGKKKVNSFEKKPSSRMQDPPLEKASSSKSENRHFTVMMTHAHIHGTSYLHVPIEYAKAHLRNITTKSVTLIVQDKDWTVGYAFRSYNKQRQSAEFSWGWKQFCKDNDLKVGDVCEFELTKKFRFQVTIYRVASKNPVHSSN